MNPVITALGTAFGTVADDMLAVITTILPIAIPVVAGVLLITFGIKIFKKISGR